MREQAVYPVFGD